MNTFRIVFKYAQNGLIREQYLDIGLIQDITNSYSVKTTNQGIPSQPSQNAFAMDYGVTRTYTFSFLRICPDEPVDDITQDSTKWSNGFWVYVMKKYVVNRWQMQTDGCKILYTSSDDEQYPTLGPTNVYVSTFTVEQTAGNTQSLSGKIGFMVGSSTDIGDTSNRKAVVYDSNFKTYKPAVNDDSNYVRATDYGSIDVMSVPSDWINNATAYGIYSATFPEEDIYAWFRWSTSPNSLQPRNDDGTYGYKPGNLIELTDKVTTLYARYNTSNPEG